MSSAAPPPVGGTSNGGPSRLTSARTPAGYVLILLLTVNFLNYFDRTLPTILAQRIKADLTLSDAQLGFLLGTAFAIFYGVLGLGMGRVADAFNRPRLLGASLLLWSMMTACSGLARTFVGLGVARLGVGVGEAAATPCAYSLLSERFSERRRALVLSTYLLGAQFGIAAALVFGGFMLQDWSHLCHQLPEGACRLSEWRATLLVSSLPGLVVAVLIGLVRERRTVCIPKDSARGGGVIAEFAASLPPFTFMQMQRLEGSRGLVANLLLVAALATVAFSLSLVFGDVLQWAALAIGTYSVVTWSWILSRRDPEFYKLTTGSWSFVLMTAGAALLTCVVSAVQVWTVPYAMRTFHVLPGEVGIALGLSGALVSGLSIAIGGAVGDAWKQRSFAAPFWITLISLVGCVPPFMEMMSAHSFGAFVLSYVFFLLLALAWSAPLSAFIQDRALPRTRAATASAFSLINILVGSGFGPYLAGKVSTMSGSLQLGMESVFVLVPISFGCLASAALRYAAEARANSKQGEHIKTLKI